MPVWEEQQLGNYSHGYPPHMPFKAPVRAAAHSALYLCVDSGGDQLVGRADNGAATDALTPATCHVSAVLVSQAEVLPVCHIGQASIRIDVGGATFPAVLVHAGRDPWWLVCVRARALLSLCHAPL